MTKKTDVKVEKLMQAIALIQDQEEARRFFTDLCTPAELDAMADRWQVVPLIREGVPYRAIQERTGVSVATITRVARCIHMGEGGYKLIADRADKA
ncbi:YerC/YecD family TrpR-related protein [Legionella londiniensis]|uniref:Putative Trp repressor n=1 Tax=Legionella londiniensis TaxID=45068 RepID=A0A0W0VQZ8_9GAMM|nr:YerC/YecD family TrpR-related protein [Legionella londiniensis]KTD22561.1 putative Trp repressor [Legionella londiniensis]STX92492.1 putative Trp repressor [Legionella londiniensis]